MHTSAVKRGLNFDHAPRKWSLNGAIRDDELVHVREQGGSMLLFGSVAAAVVAALAVVSWWWLQKRRVALANQIGLVALAVWSLGVSIKLYVDRAPAGTPRLAQAADSIAWPLPEPLPLVGPTPSAATPDGAVTAAPIESLIGGLEARLAAEPNDAGGWALLAQSYAFVANTTGVESAVERAVALGVDEQTLRAQVQRAERSVPPRDWVQEMIRPRGSAK
jgi:hypothetical protein